MLFANSNDILMIIQHLQRNETTYLDQVQYVWEAGNAVDMSGFNVHLRIRIPPEVRFVIISILIEYLY